MSTCKHIFGGNFFSRGVNSQEFSYPEYVGEDINKFCHVNDLQQLQKHHSEGK